MLNSNKIINNEFNKVVENLRTKKLLEISKSRSVPGFKTKFQQSNFNSGLNNLKGNPSIELQNLNFMNKGRKSYRKQPKIRISQLPEYEGKRKTVKMNPNALKAGIARFILRNVTKAFTNSIPDNPFSKIIQLPKMMGFDTRGINSQFSKDPPLYFWHK